MTNQQTTTETPKKPPVLTLQDGYVKVKIWENQGEKGTYWSVQPLRVYKKAENDWQETNFYSGTDILRVGRLIDEAYNHIETLKEGRRINK